MQRSLRDLEPGTRLGLLFWILLACPLFGAGAALDTRAAPLSLNDLPSLLLFLFGVPLVLVLVTGALGRFQASTTAAMVAASLAVTCGWGLLIAAAIGSVAD